MRKPWLVLGIGINDNEARTHITKNGKLLWTDPAYSLWIGMLNRCYSAKEHERAPTYTQCTIDPDWLFFSVFKEWFDKQDTEGKEIDKDILTPGNQHYCPEECCFVSPALNRLLNRNKRRRGKYPQGVSLSSCHKPNRFHVSIRIYGKQRFLGTFQTPEEGSHAYNRAKAFHIAEIMHEQTDIRIIRGLYRHAIARLGA